MKKSASSVGDSEPLRPARDRRAALWTLCVLVVAGWLGVLWSRGLVLETSVLAMLPPSERDAGLHGLTKQLSGRAARTLVVLVGHESSEEALAAAAVVQGALSASPAFSSVRGAFDPATERAFFELYFPHRHGMLSSRLRAELEQGAGPKDLARRVMSLLQSPASSLYTPLLERDPLLLYAECLQGWAQANAGVTASDGFLLLEHGGKTFALLTAETASDPFDADGQREAIDAIEGLRAKLSAETAGLELLFSGVPRFAAHTRDAMKRDIAVIGTGSMLGTALCILLAFYSLRPFLLSFLPVAVGTLTAMLATFVVFDRVHFLTLVFGTSLTGLGVDYALHYFSAHRMAGRGWNSRQSMREIFPGITLGVFTSVLGFSGLYFTPFPVLRQFALFSSVGLIGAWATVVCWYPPLLAAPHRLNEPPWLQRRCAAFLDLWSVLRSRRWASVLLAVLCVAAVGAPFLLRYEDDVRRFQSSPVALLQEDQRVREIAGRADDSRFILVQGESTQATLERLENTAAIVRAGIASGLLDNCRDVSMFLPSRARQAADRALLGQALLPKFDELRTELDEIGFDGAVVESLRAELERPAQEPLDVEQWLASPASELMRTLWIGATERGFGALILLGGLRDGAALEASLAGRPGVHYVDTVRDMSRLVERYRIDTTRLVIVAYIGVLAALLIRFGPINGLRVMLPSLLSAGLTLAILVATGTDLNLFHLLGLLLVLGLAVDYGVIFAENGTSEATALFAVLLSVLATVMAFGLMVTSSAPPLRSLGASVSLGVVLALVFSPLACLSSPAREAGAKKT